MFPLLAVAALLWFASSQQKKTQTSPPATAGGDASVKPATFYTRPPTETEAQELERLFTSIGCSFDDAIAANPTAKAQAQNFMVAAWRGEIAVRDLYSAASNYRAAGHPKTASCLEAFAAAIQDRQKRIRR